MSKATELLRRVDDLELQVGRAIDEIRACLDEPEAKPFGYVSQHTSKGPFEWVFNKEPTEVYPDTALSITPVYLHPLKREWQRLTDEEIMAIVRNDDEFDEMMWDKAAIRYAQAIERALRGKNE
jgi:hypothetical protein